MLEEVNLKAKLEKADYEALMPALKQQLAALEAPDSRSLFSSRAGPQPEKEK